ncbi:S53 family peptidase [Microbacterium sp. KUDC0406]|uniref:S53 family peptidase n=1 Tax=Microbacterium sp. KUDC0406 TaxID=2909588 RepID=UPI001F2FC8BF|nr:S53 family peptidase [Microbacterium sp. KUDC0406]UJP09416.1 S53 family peptidase [Microbacterium sp. KUDC0406]
MTPHAEVTVPGYTAQQIQKRLGLSGDGEGTTVAIVIAYHYPTAKEDANAAAAQFGLPQTCDVVAEGADCFDFEVVYADGAQPAVNAQWNQEAALDIQSIHAVAPKAKIVLVESKDATAAAMYRAVDKAASLKPTAISNSWGMSEFSEEAFYNKHCALTTSACLQSTGDFGWPSSYGSTNPHILSVGGTNLKLDEDGDTVSESAWAKTGGGVSFFQKRPAYQDGVVKGALRSTPDVSFVADPATGFSVYYTAGTQHYWAAVGGTSLSAPLWAGILAVTDQLRLADGKDRLVAVGPKDSAPLHEAIYSLDKGLSDVASGANGLCGTECTAGAGYDSVTGLGSPIAGIDKALAEK